MHRIFKQLLGWLAVAAFSATLAGAAEPQAGRDYVAINPPQPTQAQGKIEVLEFFSYGCNHCKALQPVLAAWAARLPADVSLRRVPVSFNRAPWARLARIYYALEVTGNVEKYEGAVFRALHDERANFNTDEAVVAWAASKGIDGKKFAEALASFSVQSMVPRGDQESAAYKIDGVPTLIVDGRWLVVNNGNYPQMLAVADALIEKARKEKRK
jgi:thiol:disulfide interchange protein DsbA